MENKEMERWSFGIDNDYLISLVLENKKRATKNGKNK